jgi:hypothetical protein
MSAISDFMQAQKVRDAEREFSTVMARARNAMRAVKIALEEDDVDEALRLVTEALCDDV